MAIHKFAISKHGYNLLLNGLQYYIDSARAQSKRDAAEAAQRCFDDVRQYSYLKSDGFDHDTGEIYAIQVRMTDTTIWFAFELSDWYGDASMRERYQVDYTTTLVDEHLNYVEEMRVANEELEALIRYEWLDYKESVTGKASKRAFADDRGYDYNKVLSVCKGL